MLGMLVVLGVSIADSRPLALGPGDHSQTSLLPGLMLAAGTVGFLLARSSIGVVRAHVLGAIVAAFVLLMVAGAATLESASPLPDGWDALTARVAAVWQRLDADVGSYLDDATTTPKVATFLVLGAICWTTAQFSAFSIFRYDRGGPAVMAIGVVLFLNVGLGSVQADADLMPVLPVLIVFATLAMLLLMRLQLVQQRHQWARRHIADAKEVSRLFLRTGVLFVGLAIVSATSLTVWASVDAQDVDLGDFEDPIEDLGVELSRWLGVVGVPPVHEVPTTIDDDWEIQDVWKQPNGIAFRARVDGQLRGNYWWGWAHDQFDGQGWTRDRVDQEKVPAQAPLPVTGLASAGGPHPLVATLSIEDAALARGMAFRPAEAGIIDRAVTATVIDGGGGLGDIRFAETLEPGERVSVESWVRDYSPDGSTLTANELREAGSGYPDWVMERYLQGTQPSISGTLVAAEAAEVMALADDPYDRALEVQRRLASMDYNTDMRGVCDPAEPVPECVLREEQGFCEHYATTMAMVLRSMGIPARLVTGFLPGDRIEEEWVVEQAALHNWVEAYFPGHGWVRFDPTPATRGFGQSATDFPPGPPPGSEESLPPSSSLPPETFEPLEPEPTAEPFGAGTLSDGDDPLGPAAIGLGGLAVVLVLVVVALWLVRFRRLPEADGGLAYRGIASLATRLGYGPHPSQTEYEFANSLAEALPSVRDDLFVVADARVETAYGQRTIDAERRSNLRRAYARIRTALLRLSLRWRR
jgi:transglutaminase-like putative cysteine protease